MERSAVKVLVVEDHRQLLQYLGLALTMLGWEAFLSSNGNEALDKLGCGIPDLILLDLHMPEMDGFELARYLKQEPLYQDIPILGVTGLDTADARRQCLDAGCDDFMAKPFSLPDLKDRITRLLTAHPLGTTVPCVSHDDEPAPRIFDRYRYVSMDDFQAQKIKREDY